MFVLFDYTINSKEDLKYVSKDSKINNLYINIKCSIDSFYCTNIYVNQDVELLNCVVDGSLVINNPKNFILIRNCMIGDIKCTNIGNHNLSMHIEHNLIYDDIVFDKFIKNNKNVSIYLYQNEINKKVYIYNEDLELKDVAICISSNRFTTTNDNNIYAQNSKIIDVKDNYCLNKYKIKFLEFKQFNNYTGYNRKLLKNHISLVTLENEYRKKQIAPNKILKLKNVPQYVSCKDDPALNTGCEVTASTALLNYILNANYTKNEIASYMKYDNPGVSSFWKSFIGDIYNDGWGCMSPAIVDMLDAFLIDNNLSDKYYVYNTTNMPLYELFQFVNSGIPVIVWCTMGTKDRMYHKKHGSTIWEVNNEKLYWPGNDHCVVLAGYCYTLGKVYLADPENNSDNLTARDMYEFENRFMELYSQSVVILKKKATRHK